MPGLRDADLLLVAPFAVEAVEQAEQRADLIREETGIEKSILGHRLEELVCVLDPVGHRIRGVLQLLELLERRERWPLVPIRLRKRCTQRCRVVARLRLVALRGGRSELRERPGVDTDVLLLSDGVFGSVLSDQRSESD